MNAVVDTFGGVVFTHVALAYASMGLALLAAALTIWFCISYRRHIGSLRVDKRGRTQRDGAVWRPAFLAGLLVCIGVLATSGPQRKTVEPKVEYKGACVGIGIDGSFSMLAPERKGAMLTRLRRAIAEVDELVRSFPEGDRLALMAFAGSPQIFQPAWTTDREHIFFPQLAAINEAYVSFYGRSGSDIPAAIGTWVRAFPDDGTCQRFVLLFTDGEPEGEEHKLKQGLVSSLEVFARSEQQVVIFMVAVGDATEPLRIREYDEERNFAGFAANEKGDYIFSQPNLLYLEDIASRFRVKLIFAEQGKEDLRKKIAGSIASARAVAAMRSYEVYMTLVPWFAVAFVVVFACLLYSLLRV